MINLQNLEQALIISMYEIDNDKRKQGEQYV